MKSLTHPTWPPQDPSGAEPKLLRCDAEKALLLHPLAQDWEGKGPSCRPHLLRAGVSTGLRGMQLRQTLG